ncbi:hypothetical protein JAAARDRAFT_39881 [Jaapia argillacea MUCL 33604]|uniref:UBX domain-containing protein n=1 Tax=Jaapia argillacea MUCL 33604 TaxID=933084 RepID=A0A067PDI2_9AGAM|nr:hypothetical protein JAAARDRAFT_39881 [Jaapia argillacea MUCL 33604]
MSRLTESQAQAVHQLQSMIGGDEGTTAQVLESVNWDVQRAVDVIFESDTPRRIVPKSSTNAQFEVDDSEQGMNGPERPVAEPSSLSLLLRSLRAGSLLSLVALPFQIVTTVFRFIFSFLHLPIPSLRFSTLTFYRAFRTIPPRPSDPHNTADRWVRSLEEDTGATCVNRGRMSQTTAVSGNNAGPSTLAPRFTSTSTSTSVAADGKKLLPEFVLGSYEEALRSCQKEARIGCIILVSDEHDDAADFKRRTLTDPRFVKLLSENNFVVWGGDIRDREPWSAAQKLQATTYPFVAFLALQPRRNSSSNPGSPSLTVLSRHQGRPTSSSGPTSADSLVDHLEQQVLPRIMPFLERTQQAFRERERDRLLREQQDQAFHDSARRDRERIEARMEIERTQKEEERKAEERRRLDEESRIRRAQDKLDQAATRIQWRRWARKSLAVSMQNSREGTRIAVRLPSGERVIKQFSCDATLTSLYTFVATLLIPKDLDQGQDPDDAPEGLPSGDVAVDKWLNAVGTANEWWGFKLLLAYPRQEIGWEAGALLTEQDGLRGGGQVVIEMMEGVHEQGFGSGEEDGYDTEDSDS